MQRLIASWFGTGLVLGRLRGSDAGSGTVGSLFALLPALALGNLGWWVQLAAAAVVTAGSLWSARTYAVDGADPGWVVVDEAAGTFLAVVGLDIGPALVSFVVFRVADITKLFPGVDRAEALPGSIGITLDDLAAGLWGLATGWAVTMVLG